MYTRGNMIYYTYVWQNNNTPSFHSCQEYFIPLTEESQHTIYRGFNILKLPDSSIFFLSLSSSSSFSFILLQSATIIKTHGMLRQISCFLPVNHSSQMCPTKDPGYFHHRPLHSTPVPQFCSFFSFLFFFLVSVLSRGRKGAAVRKSIRR